MAEYGKSIQRNLKLRSLDGSQPTTAEEIIVWLEAVARAWIMIRHRLNGGKRAARRARQRQRRNDSAVTCKAAQARPLAVRFGAAQRLINGAVRDKDPISRGGKLLFGRISAERQN